MLSGKLTVYGLAYIEGKTGGMRKEGKMTEIIKNYRDNALLRHSFNTLAEETFGLDFEAWYQNGFWGDDYNPYSIVKGGQIVANVSVNRTDFLYNGRIRHFLQLGTVMTKEAYRRRGCIRAIMEQIEADYNGKTDGIYLFANDNVLDFYPRFGFREAQEYQYDKTLHTRKERTMERVSMERKEDWDKVERAVKESVCNGAFDQAGNSSLIMFYLTKYMRENVYYEKNLEVYAVAETEGKSLLLHQVFSRREADPAKVTAAFGKEIERVSLGFTPKNPEEFECSLLKEEDTTLFVKGKAFDDFDRERMRFPVLARA